VKRFPNKDKKEIVEISVLDTGIGIKKQDQFKLFKLFSMVSASNQ